MRINGKVVRILGFNHDDLVNLDSEGNYKNAYGDGQTNTKAGISFEYVDFILPSPGTAQMNDSYTSKGGWTGSAMYTPLNTTQYNNLPNEVRKCIKQVIKKYTKPEIGETLYDSKDYLWLLSCMEIWGTYGTEGKQYKYYTNIMPDPYQSYNYLKKPFNVAGKSSEGIRWWLRSTSGDSSKFCYVSNYGGRLLAYASGQYGIAPGFAI